MKTKTIFSTGVVCNRTAG